MSTNFDETVRLQSEKRQQGIREIRERLQGIGEGTSSAPRLASSSVASFPGRNECPVGNDWGNNFGRGRGLMSAPAGAGVYEGTRVLYVHLKRLDAQYIPIKLFKNTTLQCYPLDVILNTRLSYF